MDYRGGGGPRMTLTQYIQRYGDEAEMNDLLPLMYALSYASKIVSNRVWMMGIENLFGLANKTNVHNEDVKKLDLIANQAFVMALGSCGKVCAMVSEEDEAVIPGNDQGRYVVSFDPLDGSSNLDCNVSVGSIFGIHRRISPIGEKATKEDMLQPAARYVTAGYVLYGNSTIMMISLGKGVHGFTLDNGIGEFVLTHDDVRIKPTHPIYSMNEGNSMFYDAETRAWMHEMKEPENKKPFSLRYVGSMVADMHRTLVYGGVFAYPADSKSVNGKLRLLYEVAPMAFLTEHAGGHAIAGRMGRVLTVQPSDIHQRVPAFLGSPVDIDKIAKLYGCQST